MAWSYEEIIAQLTIDYGKSEAQGSEAFWHWVDANTAWSLGNDHEAIGELMYGMGHILNSIGYLRWKKTFGYNGQTFALTTALDPAMAFPEGLLYTLTAKKICEAWAVDDFNFAPVTIAFIDRMRQLIWDEPFLAVWSAKPEKEY